MSKVLVVNNDIDTMSLLQAWLEKKSFEVKYTGDPEEVATLIKEFKPQLALVDVLQKDVIKIIKEDKSSTIPVILMTGYTAKKLTGELLPVDDVIEKPFNLHLLEEKLKKHIG